MSCDSLARDHPEDYPHEVTEAVMRLSSHTRFQYADAGPDVVLTRADGRGAPAFMRSGAVLPTSIATAPALARRPMP
jgi:hypothetical protein